MTWNNRVIRTTYTDKFGTDYTFAIHEVYYNERGEITHWTERAIIPSGDSFTELYVDLRRYVFALNLPVLEERDGTLVAITD